MTEIRQLCAPASAALVLPAIFLVASVSVAQEPRAMTAVDLISMPSISDPRLSPDGQEAIYVVTEADWPGNQRTGHIWRTHRASREEVQLTSGAKGESSPRYSPDGSWIAFLAERDGDDNGKQIYLLPSRGGEARRLTMHETAVSRIEWSADGKSLLFLASEAKTAAEKARDEAKDDVFAFDEDFKQRHLWRVDIARSWSGGSTDDGSQAAEIRLTSGDFSVRGYQLSEDGRRIVVQRAPTPLFDDSDESEVWIYDLPLSETAGSAEMAAAQGLRLTDNSITEGGASLSPDGSTVLFVAGANQRFETYYNDNLFLVPAAGGAHRMLLPEMPYDVSRARFAADGRSIFFLANTGVRVELFRVELSSQRMEQLTSGDHAIRGWQYLPERDEHLVAINTPTNAGDLWALSSGAEGTQLTHRFDDLAERFRIPRQEAVTWKGADGVQVEGLLYYPLDYAPGTRYPLVVQTHGGPAASDTFGFPRWSGYVPVLAARGWMVLKPNYRGSTGYGDEFLRDMVGHYFHQAHLDVMTGVDALIERGLVDGERMVKMGWSAGGHMTNKIITHTDRFKAASSGAGAANWISMYGQSDVRIYRTPWFGGTPWQENAPIDTYWDHSPLKDIAKVKTPTLVLVGQNDARVPMPQSVELYRALKSNGVPTHLYVAPRTGHGWRELRHQLFKVNVELEWFERHARGHEYQWEAAPGADATAATAETVSSESTGS